MKKGQSKVNRLRLQDHEVGLINYYRKLNTMDNSEERILIIGDIHEPFCLKGYLDFCVSVYLKYTCNRVIFIGDIIDNHYTSYHETDANGLGGGDELDLAIKKIRKWYKAFPKADVIIGNHDRLIMRKAQTSAIPSKWIKEYKDVLKTPNWNFVNSVVYNDVKYIHGEGGTARARIKADMQSVVQGHLHTQAYCEWSVGSKFKVFGMQVGCGIDHEAYAMAYAKAGKKPAIGCSVVLDNGKTPINILMDL
jgi:metallophosphoesterase superfamily enzyme